MVDTFKGYNHNLRISDGEFFDMKNLTSDYYPILSPRGNRGVYASPASPQGLISKDSLCYVDGAYFVMNEYRIDMGLNDEPKQLISMGAYVIIMPDKKYINTQDLTDYGNIEATFQTGSNNYSTGPTKGNDVKALQILLMGNGCAIGKWGADGDFGISTENAVKDYQRKKKLQADGVAGPATWGKLLGVS